MRLAASLTGELERIMAEELKVAERAVTAGVRQATDGLKTELRGQVTGAGLGSRLARSWRGQTYPKGQTSITAAGLVWSKAPGTIRVYEKARASSFKCAWGEPSRCRTPDDFMIEIDTGKARGDGLERETARAPWPGGRSRQIKHRTGDFGDGEVVPAQSTNSWVMGWTTDLWGSGTRICVGWGIIRAVWPRNRRIPGAT